MGRSAVWPAISLNIYSSIMSLVGASVCSTMKFEEICVSRYVETGFFSHPTDLYVMMAISIVRMGVLLPV